MKASKLITKEQKNKMFGEYVKLKNILSSKMTFEKYLTTEIKLN